MHNLSKNSKKLLSVGLASMMFASVAVPSVSALGDYSSKIEYAGHLDKQWLDIDNDNVDDIEISDEVTFGIKVPASISVNKALDADKASIAGITDTSVTLTAPKTVDMSQDEVKANELTAIVNMGEKNELTLNTALQSVERVQQPVSSIWDNNTPRVGNWSGQFNYNVNVVGRDAYNIVFDANGGDCDTQSLTDVYGAKYTMPSVSKVGHNFGGWTDGIDTYQAGDEIVLKEGANYTAIWSVNNYVMSYNTNGGTTIEPREYAYGAITTEPTAPTKTGYTFDGWFTDDTYTTPYEFTTMKDESITLYAKYVTNTYNMSYGGTSLPTTTYKYGEAVKSPTAPTKTGYTFDGWFTDDTYNIPYVFSTMPSNDVTIYAKFSATECLIKYNDTGDALSQYTEATPKYDETYTLPEPTKTGYTLTGWTDGTTTYLPNATLTAKGNKTFTALWTLKNTALANDLHINGNTLMLGDAGGMTICNNVYPTNVAVEIPCEYNGKAVTEIGAGYFSAYTKNVTIPTSVTKINAMAFGAFTGTIHYNGSMAEWQQIEKKSWLWSGGSDTNVTIICSDGELTDTYKA